MQRMLETSKWLALTAILGLSFAACGDDPVDETEPEVPGEIPMDPDSDRRCPETVNNEALQFSEGFSSETNVKRFQGRYVFHKSYVADLIVNPGAAQNIEGRLFRASANLPGMGDPLANEKVYLFAEVDGEWTEVASAVSNAQGYFSYEFGAGTGFEVGNHRVLSILAANGSCIEHGVFVWPEDTPAMTTDIDATLTTDDNENLYQIFTDIEYVQRKNPASDDMMNAWYDKGYEVTYVTARPWDYQGLSRVWLREQGYPFGPLELAPDFVHGETAAVYKAAFVERVLGMGIDFVAAYGNAISDVDGFLDGGIPIERIWSMGEARGHRDANEVPEGPPREDLGDYTADYTTHIPDFVEVQPDAVRTFER